MIAYLVGLVSGAALPLQTSVNTKLRERISSPLLSSLISFCGGTLLLGLISVLSGEGLTVPLARVLEEPFWMWLGGPCGVILITLNILLLPRLGSVQTVILCVLGQVLTGILIDHFGWFHAEVIALTPLRAAGALLVVVGVAAVSLEKGAASPQAERKIGSAALWLFRAGGVVAGVACAVQVAVNAHLAAVTASPVKSSFYSFAGGALTVALMVGASRCRRAFPAVNENVPRRWWLYVGGALGVVCVIANVYLAQVLGTGMAVVISLIGQILGSLAIDVTGALGAEKKRMTMQKIFGLLVMTAGAAMIRML